MILQAGPNSLDGSVDPLLGISAVRLKCWAADLRSAILDPAPDISLPLIETQPRTFERDPSGDQGGYTVMITLEGHLTPDKAEGTEYTLDGATSEDPIESHPDLGILLETYDGDDEDGKGRAKWPRTLTGDDGAEARNPMHGVESYLLPGATWTKRWASPVFHPSLLKALGTFDTPAGKPPPLNGRRQWFKTRVRASRRGNVWEIEEAWMVTGPHGVAPELYRRSA